MASTRKSAGERKIKEKFLEEREGNITPIVPLNELQADYIRYLNTKKLVIATGLAGTSKTFLATVTACDKWRMGEISRIYLTRPNVSEVKSLGYFSGDLVEKMSNWLLPVLNTMYQRLGRPVVEIAIKNGDISFVPLEVIKGMSFGAETFVICDEAEDIDEKMAKVIVTRMGGCTMVLAGDLEQSALSSKSGLAMLKRMVENHPNLEKYVGLVDFNRPSDIVRSPECREWILAFRQEDRQTDK